MTVRLAAAREQRGQLDLFLVFFFLPAVGLEARCGSATMKWMWTGRALPSLSVAVARRVCVPSDQSAWLPTKGPRAYRALTCSFLDASLPAVSRQLRRMVATARCLRRFVRRSARRARAPTASRSVELLRRWSVIDRPDSR